MDECLRVEERRIALADVGELDEVHIRSKSSDSIFSAFVSVVTPYVDSFGSQEDEDGAAKCRELIIEPEASCKGRGPANVDASAILTCRKIY